VYAISADSPLEYRRSSLAVRPLYVDEFICSKVVMLLILESGCSSRRDCGVPMPGCTSFGV